MHWDASVPTYEFCNLTLTANIIYRLARLQVLNKITILIVITNHVEVSTLT
jgi:hypothetical protein